jgi:hypothetical protein
MGIKVVREPIIAIVTFVAGEARAASRTLLMKLTDRVTAQLNCNTSRDKLPWNLLVWIVWMQHEIAEERPELWIIRRELIYQCLGVAHGERFFTSVGAD